MADKTIRAVLFDLGETLLNFGKISTAAVFRQSARHTYDFLRACGQPVGGFTWYRLHSMLSVRLRCVWAEIAGRDFDALSLLKKNGEKRGFQLTDEQWRQLGWLWYEPLSRLAQIESGLRGTLVALKQMGLKLGIVSNTFISAGSLDKHLAQLGILDFFPVRLYSYQFPFRKPDTRIFKAAGERISEPAEHILFVGDRISYDIIPARKAGMQVVLKRCHTNAGRQVPDGIVAIERLCELPGLIASVNKAAEQVARPQTVRAG